MQLGAVFLAVARRELLDGDGCVREAGLVARRLGTALDGPAYVKSMTYGIASYAVAIGRTASLPMVRMTRICLLGPVSTNLLSPSTDPGTLVSGTGAAARTVTG